MDKTNLLEGILLPVLLLGILITGILIIQFLISAGKKSKKDDPHALGLPQGSVRAVLSISLIVFFILIALFFYLDSPAKYELAESILTILGTLVIAVSSFYFGIKATEQGNKIAQETFQKVTQGQKSKEDNNIPPSIIQEAICANKEAWKKQYNCVDIKLGKKKAGNTKFDLNCIKFLVEQKNNQANTDSEIPLFIEYSTKGISYHIPTDVEECFEDKSQNIKNYGSLSEEQQYNLVEAYIESKIDDFLDLYPSITGAGASKKLIDNNPIPLICLQLQVEKKSDNASIIPPFVPYNSFQIPTDVVEAGKTTPCLSLNPLITGVSRLNDNEFGSMGFPVYHNGELHIISCYHVLFSKELRKSTFSVDSAKSDTIVVNPPFTDNNNEVGNVVEGQLNKFLDVAIMKPSDSLKAKYEQAGYSTEYAILNRSHENRTYLKFKGSKSQRIKKPCIKNVATLQPIDFKIAGNKIKTIRMRGLIQMEKAALPGDSGAAVYDYQNRVAGIIVAADDTYSYAVSAYNIFHKTDYSLNP